MVLWSSWILYVPKAQKKKFSIFWLSTPSPRFRDGWFSNFAGICQFVPKMGILPQNKLQKNDLLAKNRWKNCQYRVKTCLYGLLGYFRHGKYKNQKSRFSAAIPPPIFDEDFLFFLGTKYKQIFGGSKN